MPAAASASAFALATASSATFCALSISAFISALADSWLEVAMASSALSCRVCSRSSSCCEVILFSISRAWDSDHMDTAMRFLCRCSSVSSRSCSALAASSEGDGVRGTRSTREAGDRRNCSSNDPRGTPERRDDG